MSKIVFFFLIIECLLLVVSGQPSACSSNCFRSQGETCKRKSGENCPPCVRTSGQGAGKFECVDPVNGSCSAGWTDCRGPQTSPPTSAPTSAPNPVPNPPPTPPTPPPPNPPSNPGVPTQKPPASPNTPPSSSGETGTPQPNNSPSGESNNADSPGDTPSSPSTAPTPNRTTGESEPDPNAPPSVDTEGNSDNPKTVTNDEDLPIHDNLLTSIPPNSEQISSGSTNGGNQTPGSSDQVKGSPIVAVDSSNSTTESSSTWLITIIVGCIIIILIGCAVCYYFVMLRRRNEANYVEPNRVILLGQNNHTSQPDQQNQILFAAALNSPSTATTANTFVSASNSLPSSSISSKLPSSKSSSPNSALSKALLPYRIDTKEIEDINPIGSGGFAVVWLVKYRDTMLASKRLHIGKNNIQSEDQLKQFSKEIAIVSSLRHENIVTFIGVAWETDAVVQVLFEFMEGGDLRECLLRKNQDVVLPSGWGPKKFSIAKDVACALNYVHSFRPPLLHRDVKARNILLNSDYTLAKLSDFGVSRNISLNSQSQSTMTAGVGTTRWLAPEVLTGARIYNEKSDIYSFGMLLLEMDTHDIPYSNLVGRDGKPLEEATIVFRMATDDLKPLEYFSENCDDKILGIATRCLQREPSDRPSAVEIAFELENLSEPVCIME